MPEGRVERPARRFSFSPKTIAKLPAPPKSVVYHDTRQPSLSLRCDPNGRRVFFFFRSAKGYTEIVRDPATGEETRKYRGRNVHVTVGEYPSTTVDHARSEAGKLQAKLADWRAQNYQGPSPFESPTDVPTLSQVLDSYVTKRIQGHAARPERAEKSTRWLIDKYVPWKGWTLDAITHKSVRDLHQRIGVGQKHKIAANRVLELIRRLYTWAGKERLYAGENPTRGIEFFARQERERFLGDKDPSELKRLFAALQACPNRDLRDFVLLSLFCGARRSDTSSMRWQDVTVSGWHIPHSKGNRSYSVPLVAEAIEILEQRRKLVDPASPFVFPSATSKSGYVMEWKRGWKTLLKQAQITERLTIHDLRRTSGAMQAASGASLIVIGKSLGHLSNSSTRIYARLNLEPVQRSMTAGVAIMTAAAAAAATPTPAPATPRKRKARRPVAAAK